MAKKRGRRPGSKKKPDPGYTIRIPEETLSVLKQAAWENGRKLSDEIRARLDYTLGRYRKGGHDLPPHLRPLVDMFAYTARYIEARFGRRWYENRLTGRELAKAINHVMVEFSPDADDVTPPKVIENAKRHGPGEKVYLANPGTEEATSVIVMLRTALGPLKGMPYSGLEYELWKIRRDLEKLSRRKGKK